MLTIAIAQTGPKFLDTEANFTEIVELTSRVEADLYLFPELCLSGYTFSSRMQVESCSLPRETPASQWSNFTELDLA